MEDIQNQILLIGVCLLLSGLFSGLEIAFISRDKLNFEIKSNSKSFFGKVFGKINKNTSSGLSSRPNPTQEKVVRRHLVNLVQFHPVRFSYGL